MSVPVLLVVDDRPDNLFVLEQLLAAYLPDLKMLAAPSAEVGLKLAVSEPIDGALIDVQMPGMNGIEMCRRLKADPRTAPIHVILVTAHRATPELKAQGLEAGANDFIAKPIDNTELTAKLRAMLRLRAAEQALRRERNHLEEKVQERTKALRDAEYRSRTLFQTAADPIFINDREGRLLEVNEEACRLLGYTRDELLRLTVYDVITPESSIQRPDILEQLQTTGLLQFESELITRDRLIIPIECRSRLLDLQGQPAVLSIARDITERKHREKALQKERDLAQQYLDIAAVMMLILDSQGCIALINKKGCEVLGYREEEILKRDWFDIFFPEEDRDKVRAVFADLLAGRIEPWAYVEHRVLTKSGEKRLIAWRNTVLRDDNGAIIGTLSSGEDITQRKQAEEDLRKSGIRDRAILDTAIDGFWLLDLEGRLLEVNDAYCRMSGYSQDEIQLMTIPQIEVRENAIEVAQHMQKIITTGAHCFTTVHRRKNGSTFPVEVSAKYLPFEDGRFFCFIRDITERQQAEEALKESLARTTAVQYGTIEALATVTETRDPYTAGHQRRVTRLACAVARELGLPADRVAGLRVMGLLHDLGKIVIPAEILSKTGKLNDPEFAFIKCHAQAGYEIVKEIPFPWPVAEVILQHHERLDGSGYPGGLTGPDILLEARILAVADVVEAMSSHRPYRAALGLDRALKEIARHKGLLYDPEVVDACIKVCTEENFTFS